MKTLAFSTEYEKSSGKDNLKKAPNWTQKPHSAWKKAEKSIANKNENLFSEQKITNRNLQTEWTEFHAIRDKKRRVSFRKVKP